MLASPAASPVRPLAMEPFLTEEEGHAEAVTAPLFESGSDVAMDERMDCDETEVEDGEPASPGADQDVDPDASAPVGAGEAATASVLEGAQPKESMAAAVDQDPAGGADATASTESGVMHSVAAHSDATADAADATPLHPQSAMDSSDAMQFGAGLEPHAVMHASTDAAAAAADQEACLSGLHSSAAEVAPPPAPALSVSVEQVDTAFSLPDEPVAEQQGGSDGAMLSVWITWRRGGDWRPASP